MASKRPEFCNLQSSGLLTYTFFRFGAEGDESGGGTKTADPAFKILAIKLEPCDLPTWWNAHLHCEWKSDDEPGSVVSLLEAILGRKVVSWITGAAFLSPEPSSVIFNESASVAEHSRNWVLYYLGHVKQLVQSVATVGYTAEHQDTLEKLLGLSLMKQIPAIQAGK